MLSAPEFCPPPYSGFPGYPNIADEHFMPQHLSVIGDLGEELPENRSLYSTAQLDTFQDDWPSVPDRINPQWDNFFDSDWVLYPDSLESAELPDDAIDISAAGTAACIALDSLRLSNGQAEITHTCVILSNCCSLEEAQTILDGYVQRISRTRQLEAQGGKKKRSANAFFLYRIAFRNVAEQVCGTKSQQRISKVCGWSWREEPKNVKEYFQNQAKIQKENHEKTFSYE